MLLFTEAQLRELELQTLIFNHLASGIPIPPHLFAHFKRNLYFLDPYSLSPPSMSYGRRAEEDREPWRCKRTDGKKWRCSKEAFQDSKYCERHMHRGKKSSRKLVENLRKITPPPPPPPPPAAAAAANTSLFLGSPSCYNFFKDEEKQQQQQQQKKKHCYVLGADLMLKTPVMVEREQEPKPLLCLFSNDQEEAYCSKTQLSISIP